MANGKSHPAPGVSKVRYPGERMLENRKKAKVEGVSVDPQVWAQIQELASGNMAIWKWKI